jgi:phosphoribosylformylglycinamidine synthase
VRHHPRHLHHGRPAHRLLNSLRFGSLDNRWCAATWRAWWRASAATATASASTVGGEIAFDESYTGNPLVNVFCLGSPSRRDRQGRGLGRRQPVFYVGSKTGRDGIHGATMASAEFDEKSAEKRPRCRWAIRSWKSSCSRPVSR